MNDAALGIAKFFLFFILLEWVIVIVACVIVGKEKNRNGFLWGLFLNLIGLIVIAILPPLEPKQIEEKPPIKKGWFVFYFLMILFGCLSILTRVGGEFGVQFGPLISIIVAVYFASIISRNHV
jgi:hypothetical protein